MNRIFNKSISPLLHSSDAFPKTSQNPPGAFGTDTPQKHPSSCALDLNELATELSSASSLTQRVVSKTSGERSPFSLSEIPSFRDRYDVISEEQRQHVLTMLSHRLQKIQDAIRSPLFSSHQKAALIQLTHPLQRSLECIKESPTLQQVCHLLDTAERQVSDQIENILSTLLPPLALKFENQSASIWLNPVSDANRLQTVGLEKPLGDSSRKKILCRLQELMSDIEQSMNLDAGNFSEATTQQLLLALDRRKKYLSETYECIQKAQKNEDVYDALLDLMKVVADETRSFRSILESPQRSLLEEEVFVVLTELFEMRRELGEPLFRDA